MTILWRILIVLPALGACALGSTTQPTTDDGSVYLLTKEQQSAGAHHVGHSELFSRGIDGFNVLVLRAVDKVQSTAPEGGGYFIGVKAKPAESPIGYELKLFDYHSLLKPPRKSSYCSGATYAAFIETLNLLFPEGRCVFCPPPIDPQKTAGRTMTPERIDAMRMQERDGSRREDGVKLWGNWNDDGPGSQYALVQYLKIGEEVSPARARPGDFANINWTNGGGHSVVFLGWIQDDAGNKSILYWASQPRTNGLGDQQSSLNKIASIKFVRLKNVHHFFFFDPETKVKRKVTYEKIDW